MTTTEIKYALAKINPSISLLEVGGQSVYPSYRLGGPIKKDVLEGRGRDAELTSEFPSMPIAHVIVLIKDGTDEAFLVRVDEPDEVVLDRLCDAAGYLAARRNSA